MAHEIRFLYIAGNDVQITNDLNELKEMINNSQGSTIKLEYGADGKLLSSDIIKQSGEFEPIYVLRAGDDTAATAVRAHADMLSFRGVNINKVVSAKAIARTFENYSDKKKAD